MSRQRVSKKRLFLLDFRGGGGPAYFFSIFKKKCPPPLVFNEWSLSFQKGHRHGVRVDFCGPKSHDYRLIWLYHFKIYVIIEVNIKLSGIYYRECCIISKQLRIDLELYPFILDYSYLYSLMSSNIHIYSLILNDV